MDSVSLFVSQAGAAFGQPDTQAASLALAGQPVPDGAAIEMKFEQLFATLLGAANTALAPSPKLAAKPLESKKVESEKEPAAAPVIFLPVAMPQIPAPLPLDLLNLSLPKPEKTGDAEAPRATAEHPIDDAGVAAAAPAKHSDVKITAFDGRLLEIEQSEPKAPTGPTPVLPNPAPPTGERIVATHPVPAPANRSSEKENLNRQPEGAVATFESHRMPDSETAKEQISEQPVSRAEQADLAEPQPQAPAANGINVRLGDDPASTVHLRVAERAGEIHFDVRAANVELAGALRAGLPDLIRNLQNSGYQAEIWNSGKAIQPSTVAAPGSGEFGEDTAGQRHRRESEPKQQNKNSPRRKSNFASAV